MKPMPGEKGVEQRRKQDEGKEVQGLIWAGHRVAEGAFENGMCRPYF